MLSSSYTSVCFIWVCLYE